MTTIQFLQQIIAKIISVVASLIVALGVVQMPVNITYEIPPHKIPEKEIIKEIIPAPLPKPMPEEIETLGVKDFQTPSVEKNPSPAKISESAISLTELNTQVRKTIVNILCTTQTGGSFKPITGSGVIISPQGVILTNAHIGQYFLLENEPSASYLECVIRAGDIANPAYDAKLLYIPSVWIEKNAANIIQQEPKGTGENDYSFLLINKSIVQGKELPENFAFSEPNFAFENLPVDLSVLLASYPAGFIGGIEVQKNLGLTSTFAPIKSLYTFAETGPTTLDLFSLGGNIVSQGGSSGGAVIDIRDGKLIGMIVTSTEGKTTADRELNAITIPHIKRSFEKYTGKNLASFLNNPIAAEVLPQSEFNRLKEILIQELNKH